jgi:hypothetical protein
MPMILNDNVLLQGKFQRAMFLSFHVPSGKVLTGKQGPIFLYYRIKPQNVIQIFVRENQPAH